MPCIKVKKIKGTSLIGSEKLDANSISAEISGDAFDRNPVVSNPNKPVTANSWGVRKYASTSGYFQPISYIGNNGAGVAQYQFDPLQKSTFTTSPDLPSRCQMQFGLRYIF